MFFPLSMRVKSTHRICDGRVVEVREGQVHMFLRPGDMTFLASVLRRVGTIPTVAMLGMLALPCVLFLAPLLEIGPNFQWSF